MPKKAKTDLRAGKTRWITVLDLVVLLDNVYRASEDLEIGFEDPRETLRQFVSRLNRMIRIHTEDLESALWSCNLLQEKNSFRHPRGFTFEEFLRKVLRGDRFNRDYNYIEGEKGESI